MVKCMVAHRKQQHFCYLMLKFYKINVPLRVKWIMLIAWAYWADSLTVIEFVGPEQLCRPGVGSSIKLNPNTKRFSASLTQAHFPFQLNNQVYSFNRLSTARYAGLRFSRVIVHYSCRILTLNKKMFCYSLWATMHLTITMHEELCRFFESIPYIDNTI